MDRAKLLSVLLPAGAAAGVILLIGILIAMGESPSTPTSGSPMPNPYVLPALDAPEWQPLDPKYPGLKFWDVNVGVGEPCPAGVSVTIHYTGWTTDGKVFDSSKRRGEPAKFPLGNLIQGWQVGIPGMKPGGIRRLSIPYELGYGAAGKPPSIPPKATLIFEVELISVP